MRTFNYSKIREQKWDSEVLSLIAAIYKEAGKQELYLKQKPEELEKLVEIAKVQSTEASNAIEGIVTTSTRIRQLVEEKTTPKNRDEQEIAGYRDVLNTIHESHDHIPPKSAIILQLHRDLYKFESYNIGGKYKTADNVIEEEDSQGIKKIRFKPVPAWETPEAMEELCRAFEEAMATGEIDPLLLIPMFILDFLCIHPFNDGNGRMSRLLTLLLLYRSGYIVGKYISIERMIENSKELYYECLRESSENWYENKNDYTPFVKYMLGVIVGAYREFSSRIKLLITQNISKPERIEEIIKNTLGTITKKEIAEKCPDISVVTIQRTLAELLTAEKILKIGGGRYTKYTWNNE